MNLGQAMLNVSTRSSNEIPNSIIINEEYIILKNIYKGSLYNLYLALQKESVPSKFVLIKMKRINQQEQCTEQFFIFKLNDTKCVPKTYSIGEQLIKEQLYYFQVMERTGPSLKLLYKFMSKQIPIQLICLIALQTLTCLEQVHKHFIIHRNIKPKKLLLSQNCREILLTDFKYACRYKKQGQNLIVNDSNSKLKSCKSFLNKFSSLNQHLESVPSPKDDLESLAFMILYFSGFGQCLNIKNDTKAGKCKQLQQIKINMIPELTFKGAPLEFIQFLTIIRMSCNNDFPQDYEKYKQLFKKLLNSYNLQEKDIFYPHLDIINNISPQQTFRSGQQEQQSVCDSLDEEQNVFGKMSQLQAKQFHHLTSLDCQQNDLQLQLQFLRAKKD